MTNLSEQQQAAFGAAVREAARRREVGCAVRNVYVAVQDAIDLRRPVCAASGRCCRFEEFGHLLFVTTMEVATFVGDVKAQCHLEAQCHSSGTAGGCAFQKDKLCGVHEIRPFGCRIFFCDETATDWQQEQYARFHGELQRLHERLEVPYFYVEWRQALAAVGRPMSL